MGTTLEREDESAADITRPPADEPAQPAITTGLTQAAHTGPLTRPTIRRAVARRSPFRSWPLPRSRQSTRSRPRRRWWRLAWHIVKTSLLLAELGAILVLASYAGLIKILPGAPPRLSIAATGRTVMARASSYCWFTPGRATCVDTGAQTTPTQKLPSVTLSKGDSLYLTFAYPAPTHCSAIAVASSDSGASPAALGALGRATGSSSLASSRLPVSLAPGAYIVTIACDWAPRSTMRWLRGQGNSSYLLAVVVTARR